jgi:hypothetical protein
MGRPQQPPTRPEGARLRHHQGRNDPLVGTKRRLGSRGTVAWHVVLVATAAPQGDRADAISRPIAIHPPKLPGRQPDDRAETRWDSESRLAHAEDRRRLPTPSQAIGAALRLSRSLVHMSTVALALPTYVPP